MKAQDLFEQVTADLVAAIEAGASHWQMPWRRLGEGLPRSVDGRPYRGWNALVLAIVAGDRGWTSARWATYRGWQRRGCQVCRGERGTNVVLWKRPNATNPATMAPTPCTGRCSLARSPCSPRSRWTAPTAS